MGEERGTLLLIGETNQDGTAEGGTNYVWSQLYVDGIAARDSLSSTGSPTARAYPRQDANWNVTSLVTYTGGTWTTAERFESTPYGVVTVLNSNFTTKTGGSGLDWSQFHQGLFYDSTTGLYYNRARYLDPAQGRFISADPLGYPDGASRYQALTSSPQVNVDPLGLASVGTVNPRGGAFTGQQTGSGQHSIFVLTNPTTGRYEVWSFEGGGWHQYDFFDYLMQHPGDDILLVDIPGVDDKDLYNAIQDQIKTHGQNSYGHAEKLCSIAAAQAIRDASKDKRVQDLIDSFESKGGVKTPGNLTNKIEEHPGAKTRLIPGVPGGKKNGGSSSSSGRWWPW